MELKVYDKETGLMYDVYSINFKTQLVNIGFTYRSFYQVDFIMIDDKGEPESVKFKEK